MKVPTKFKSWAADTSIRAIKTGAQSLVALVGLHAVNVVNVDWRTDLGIAAGAAVVSVLQNIQRLPYVEPSAPATTVVVTPAPVADTPAAPVA